MSEWAYASTAETAKGLAAKKVSSVELTKEVIARIERFDPQINAMCVRDFERALEAARAADAAIAKGESKPLLGVPITLKESFNLAGTPTTWGFPHGKGYMAQEDALSVVRVKAAGAVVVGKTNVPLALADWQSYNDIYGTTNNPWDVTRAPGGSSGGSAVALATGMSALEIGSDIGASIRNPAHYCGVYGHKPTYGVVPYRGHLMPGSVSISDITVAGPLARSAKDLTAMMGLLAGTEGIEAHGLQVKLPKPPFATLKDLRVAVKLNSPVSDVDQAYQNRLIALGEFLKKKVKKLTYEAAPAFSDEEAYENYITLLRATATKRMSDAEIEAAVQKARTFDPGDKSYVPLMTRAFALSHGAWLRANERRHQMAQIWDQFFGDWDVLLCPAAASAAWPHDQKGERHERYIPVNGKQVSTIDQRFWAGYSGNFYLPSTIAPIGLTPAGLPVGVQIIARAYGDLTALKVAEWIEEEFGGFAPPPNY